MAERSPETIVRYKSRIARSSLVLHTRALPTELNHIGKFDEQDYLIHIKANEKVQQEYEDHVANYGHEFLCVGFIIEWKDINTPTLFNGAYITGITKEDEMTLVAFHLPYKSKEYLAQYETLRITKQLIDRTIKIDGLSEPANRFSRLILE